MNFSEPGCAAATTTTMNNTNPLRLAHQLFSDLPHRPNRTAFTAHLTALHTAAHLLLLPQSTPAEHSFRQREHARVANGPCGTSILNATTLFLLNTCGGDALVEEHNNHHHDNGSAEESASDRATRQQQEDIYEATGRILGELAADREAYLDNMALLLTDMKARWKGDLIATGSWHHTARTLGKTGVASAQALADLVGDRHATTTITTPTTISSNTTTPCDNNDDHDHDHDSANKGRRTMQKTTTTKKPYLSEIAQYWRRWNGTGSADEDSPRPYEEVWSYIAGRALVCE